MNEELKFAGLVTRALEQQPEMVVPMDFAAKVRASLPAWSPARSPARRVMSVRRIVAASASAVMVLAMCLIAPHSTPSFTSVAFDMELILLAELGGLVALMSLRHDA